MGGVRRVAAAPPPPQAAISGQGHRPACWPAPAEDPQGRGYPLRGRAVASGRAAAGQRAGWAGTTKPPPLRPAADSSNFKAGGIARGRGDDPRNTLRGRGAMRLQMYLNITNVNCQMLTPFTLVKPRRRCCLNYTKNDHTKPRPTRRRSLARPAQPLRRPAGFLAAPTLYDITRPKTLHGPPSARRRGFATRGRPAAGCPPQGLCHKGTPLGAGIPAAGRGRWAGRATT